MVRLPPRKFKATGLLPKTLLATGRHCTATAKAALTWSDYEVWSLGCWKLGIYYQILSILRCDISSFIIGLQPYLREPQATQMSMAICKVTLLFDESSEMLRHMWCIHQGQQDTICALPDHTRPHLMLGG